jgi:hypothetical protein
VGHWPVIRHINGQIGLGFMRLSIIDLSGGHQPLSVEFALQALIFGRETDSKRADWVVCFSRSEDHELLEFAARLPKSKASGLDDEVSAQESVTRSCARRDSLAA